MDPVLPPGLPCPPHLYESPNGEWLPRWAPSDDFLSIGSNIETGSTRDLLYASSMESVNSCPANSVPMTCENCSAAPVPAPKHRGSASYFGERQPNSHGRPSTIPPHMLPMEGDIDIYPEDECEINEGILNPGTDIPKSECFSHHLFGLPLQKYPDYLVLGPSIIPQQFCARFNPYTGLYDFALMEFSRRI